MSNNPWKTLSSKIVYSNPWIQVREDQVICPDGTPGIYGVVEPSVATGVVAVNKDNEIYLVGQYRYPTKNYSWEIIEGGANKGETPLQAAKRELAEEAGLEASEWMQLGGIVHNSNCFSSETGYLYLARGLKEVAKNPDNTEVLEIRTLPFKQVLKMAKGDEITDAMSLIAIYRAMDYIS